MSSNGIQSVISDSNVVTNHPTMGEPFGKALIELAKENDKIVGLSADLAKYTDIHVLRDEFPDRFYNVGMSEQLMMCAASGLAKEGFIPFALLIPLLSPEDAMTLSLRPSASTTPM